MTPHGPDEDCRECGDCPTCDGMGATMDGCSEIYELAPGVISMRCKSCMGSGVYCPNFVGDRRPPPEAQYMDSDGVW